MKLLLPLVVPGIVARYLPSLLWNQSLEDAVLTGLVPVVTVIVLCLFVSNLILVDDAPNHALLPQCLDGIRGFLLGAALFHVMIILFGAPILELWQHTLLLSMLLSSCTTMPLALYMGWKKPREWLDFLLDLSVTTPYELYLVSSSLGAILGAYLGALPLPLDWDRPWQQWPLPCVYGTLLGHASGILVALVLRSLPTSTFARLASKQD